MSARTLVVTLLILWGVFALLTYLLPAVNVFHCIDAIAVAGALTVIVAYAPGVWDAWNHREKGISDGQMLVLAVTSANLGLIVRLGRWYLTDVEPTNDTVTQWVYNVGLWISVCGMFLFIGALATSTPKWSTQRVLAYAGGFLALVVLLLQIDFLM